MARGGYRAGAGRPKGSKTKFPRNNTLVLPQHLERRSAPGTPLEYLLEIMQDSAADVARRDRAAIAALPYTHPRISDARLGQKALAQGAAVAAEEGTEWERLLRN